MLHYKGYTGVVELDETARVFHGEVIGTRDVITFEGATVDELERAFHDSIDDYLELCAERNEAPEKPFSGRLMVRVPPDLHRQLSTQAKQQGKSLNQLITETLSRAS